MSAQSTSQDAKGPLSAKGEGTTKADVMPRSLIVERLAAAGYIADHDLATAIGLMQMLGRPLLLEGEAGVGKTEVAKALASVHETELIRLQCYEGLDQSAALYEWNYQRQLLAIQARQGTDAAEIERGIFSEDYLLERPLLAAIRRARPPVLLIDEIDRADEEFEAFLLELLSDFQISIPELGTVRATSIPHVVLTSNGTRELSDALRRRCLYHYVDYPDVDREAQQRFIAVVDVLVDTDVELVVTSHHSLDAFRTTMPDRPDAFRTASRLQLLAEAVDGPRPSAGTPPG